MSRRWDGFRVAALLAALGVAIGLIGDASAGTIRHDRGAGAYTRLAGQFDAVGQVRGQDGHGAWLGSGTLIGNRWVLTAAHVAEGADSLTFNLAGETFSARRWYINDEWTGSLLGGGDLAILELDSNATRATGIRPARRNHSKNELGQRGVFVGFGRTGTGLTGDTSNSPGRLAGRNTLDAYGSWLGGGRAASNILLADFDNARQSARQNTLGSKRRDSLEFLIASGDSGGGVFVSTSSGYRLAAVHSFVFASGVNDYEPDSDYGDGSGHTRVATYRGWIDEVLGGDAIESALHPARNGVSTLPATAAASLARWNLAPVILPIPEPASAALMAAATLALLRRRRTDHHHE